MALIPTLVNSLTEALSSAGRTLARGMKTMIEKAFSRRSREEGEAVVDIIESVHHADPEAIASKLNQTLKTVTRLTDTEPSIIAYPWDTAIKRNLIVSGRLKAARRYRIFYQADPVINGVVTGARQWYSFYTDDLKTFGEYRNDILDQVENNRSSSSFELQNITFHHVLHQRGAKF